MTSAVSLQFHVTDALSSGRWDIGHIFYDLFVGGRKRMALEWNLENGEMIVVSIPRAFSLRARRSLPGQ